MVVTVSLLTPDRNGQMGDVVLGFKSIDDYLSANGTITVP